MTRWPSNENAREYIRGEIRRLTQAEDLARIESEADETVVDGSGPASEGRHIVVDGQVVTLSAPIPEITSPMLVDVKRAWDREDETRSVDPDFNPGESVVATIEPYGTVDPVVSAVPSRRVPLLHQARIPVFYHWSPTARRASIREHGLRPGEEPSHPEMVGALTDGRPALCFAYTPSAAWGLSGSMAWGDEASVSWDLWQVYLPEAMERHYREDVLEVRVFEPVRDIWYIATRTAQDGVPA